MIFIDFPLILLTIQGCFQALLLHSLATVNCKENPPLECAFLLTKRTTTAHRVIKGEEQFSATRLRYQIGCKEEVEEVGGRKC
ncbi:hypothetical protein ECG_08017 [Echinococcus granulosus]|uniref:Secreted protein n=1 Tax=Echinococcus granulosus TaxID=6210 RepID=A0A068WXT1_ECHGR|nr:hypothetical protein ECG_08017 [Echinococcus granulosus]CDS24677.1 hypothetical protein EgrG_000292800 [Echinococcus granulosus]